MFTYIKKSKGHFQHEQVNGLSFEEFIEWQTEKKKFSSQTHFLIDKNGEFPLNYVGRLETINENWEVICKRIGISVKLLTTNVSNKKDYTTFYNDETIELVRRIDEEDIKNFGYDFDGISTTQESLFPISKLIE